MGESGRAYRSVDPDRLHASMRRLRWRIGERFPEAGLAKVAAEMVVVGAYARETSRRLGRPIYWLKALIWLMLALVFGIVVFEVIVIDKWGTVPTVSDFVQLLEPTLGAIFFLSALAAFLLSLETRIKRKRALDALHELRALAHVVDMHQLGKDPTDPDNGESRMPPDDRPLTAEELVRYLDFCAELLSILSKFAVLYVQEFPDDVAVGAVDEIETLTNGLSRKIWQKIIIARGEQARTLGHSTATT